MLASTQSLVLVLLVRLFMLDEFRGDRIRVLLKHLDRWILQLWKQAPSQVPSTFSKTKAWLFAESVRRTMIMSYLIRWLHAVKTEGHFLHTPVIEALPFDLRTSFWDRIGEVSSDVNIGTKLVSYREYRDMWDDGQLHGATTFGTMMLVAFRGKNAVQVRIPGSFTEVSGYKEFSG